MSDLTSTDYTSILKNAEGKVKDLFGLLGKDAKGGQLATSFKYEDISIFTNKFYTMANEVSGIASGNSQQMTSSVKTLINEILNLVQFGLNKEAGKAEKKVKANAAEIEANKQKATETANNISEALQGIMSDCETSAGSIKNALEEIAQLGGEQGEVAKAEKDLEEQLAIIEENKKILNDNTSDKNAKLAALQAIIAASSAIDNTVSKINAYKTSIEAQNAIVEEESENLSKLTVESTETLTQGINIMQESLTEAGVLTGKQAKIAIDAGVKTGTGVAQEVCGQVLESNCFTVAEGVKHTMAGQDKIQAGATLMKGATTGTAKLTASIGEMGSYLTNFTQFANGIGQFTKGAVALVGQYDSFVNPLIKSIGTWESVEETNNNLKKYTTEYVAQATNTEATNNQDSNNLSTTSAEQMTFGNFNFDTSGLKLKPEKSK